jgi:hypothetical protein
VPFRFEDGAWFSAFPRTFKGERGSRAILANGNQSAAPRLPFGVFERGGSARR